VQSVQIRGIPFISSKKETDKIDNIDNIDNFSVMEKRNPYRMTR
jgi:hypothetical protein